MRVSRFLLASRLDGTALENLRRIVGACSQRRGSLGAVDEPGPMVVVLSGTEAASVAAGAGVVIGVVEVSERLLELLHLRCPPPHPEVGSEVVAVFIDRVGGGEEDVREAAGLLHEKSLDWLKAHGSDVTRKALAAAERSAATAAGLRAAAGAAAPDQLPVDGKQVRLRWRTLAARMQEAGFGVEHFRDIPEDLPGMTPLTGFPDPWLQGRLGDAGARSGWIPFDLLGLFVPPPGSFSPSLPAGIHLFLPRIADFARKAGCHPYQMAWFVLLHELTHCHVHCRGSVPWPRNLSAINPEEVLCEEVASLSLRFGSDPFVGVRCPVYRGRWKIARIRRQEPLLPYSWFSSLLPVLLRVGPDRVRDGVLGLGRAIERYADDPARRLLLLEDLLEVLEGKASIAVASAIVRSWRRPVRGRAARKRLLSERDLGVHLWGACQ